MKTMPDSTLEQAAAFQTTASADDVVRFVNRNLKRIWQRRRMKATLLRPFRTVLRPLLHWLRREHFHVRGDGPGSAPVGLNLRLAGSESLALGLGLILGPRAFIFLLPLLIIIFPVAVLFGVAGIAAASLQTDADDVEHHTLVWHTMH